MEATRKIKKPQKFIPPIRKTNNKWARSDIEKAETYAEYLESVFEPFPSELTNEQETELLQLESLSDNSTPIKQIKVKEVKKFIRKKIKLKKSPEYDNINGKIVKELPLKALRLMTIIFNSVLRLQYFPTQWKIAQIIPIHKPGKDPGLVNSYRPISLLPIMSKICEKLLLERLLPEILKAKIIPEHQFGFRNQHTTIEQVNRVTRKIRNDLEEKRYVSAVFLDVSQAFDKVWHKGLLLIILS